MELPKVNNADMERETEDKIEDIIGEKMKRMGN